MAKTARGAKIGADMDSLSLIIGILFAIPLSIVANLLTPRVASWWARRSGELPRKRLARIDFELKRITHVDNSPIDVLAQVVSIVAQFVAGAGFCGVTAAPLIVLSDKVRLASMVKVSGLSPKLFLYPSTILFVLTMLVFFIWVASIDMSTPLSLLTCEKRKVLRYLLTYERNNIIEKYPELADTSTPKSETPANLLSSQ